MSLTKRGRAVLLVVLAALVVGPVLGGYAYLRSLGVVGDSDPGPKVEVEIPAGSSAQEIGELLEAENIVPSALGFRVVVYLRGGAEDIQAGSYRLARDLSAGDALDALAKGPIVEFVEVTFPEGSWIEDFARIVDRETHISGDDFATVATSGEVPSKYRPEGIDTLEGLLFPATYQVVEEDTATSLVERLVKEFEKRADRLAFQERAAAQGIRVYPAVIVASMIEGEASAANDRDKIAAVIYNRLQQDMRLEIDATVLYALGEHKEELTRSDLEIDSPYNTRVVAGLPPTPIGAPGEASLEAAVSPADGDWLFYVLADCAGHHAFSVDYDEFLANKSAYESLDC